MSLKEMIDAVLHVDQILETLVSATGNWSYVILWLIIFCETGLVVTPFLPGDSLLFAVGAFAAKGTWQIGWMWLILCTAAILGDSLNYMLGHALGARVKARQQFLGIKINPQHFVKAERFYAKYGGKAIILSRFAPIVRTFAPFVAGMARMNYRQFIVYNCVGGIMWVSTFLWLGYFFGNLPIIKERFGLVIVAIVIISFVPMVREYWIERRAKKDES